MIFYCLLIVKYFAFFKGAHAVGQLVIFFASNLHLDQVEHTYLCNLIPYNFARLTHSLFLLEVTIKVNK